MVSVDIVELRHYCRCDTDEQTELAVQMADAAEAYLDGAGVVYCEHNAQRYAQVVKALALHWMDNPTMPAVPDGLQGLINQLKFRKEA